MTTITFNVIYDKEDIGSPFNRLININQKLQKKINKFVNQFMDDLLINRLPNLKKKVFRPIFSSPH